MATPQERMYMEFVCEHPEWVLPVELTRLSVKCTDNYMLLFYLERKDINDEDEAAIMMMKKKIVGKRA